MGIRRSQGRAGAGRKRDRERWAGQEGPVKPTPGPRNVPTLTKKKKKKKKKKEKEKKKKKRDSNSDCFFPFKKFIKNKNRAPDSREIVNRFPQRVGSEAGE